jgi:hypothetical protein
METNYYIIIPASVRSAKDITPTQKLILGEIITLSKNSGTCWASNRYFAEVYDISRRSVITHIQELESKGYVKIRYKTENQITQRHIEPSVKIPEGGVQNLHGGVKNLHRGGEKISQGGVKNLHPNNTSINNTSIILSDVIYFFIKEGKTEQDAKDFFYYYESIGWVVGKNPVRNWKALSKKWISNIKPQPKLKVLE